MRLMVQSLLTDRFKLVVHFESKQGPAYALVLAKTGKTGPQLLPHSDAGAPCGAFSLSPRATLDNGLPASCGIFITMVDGGIHTSARSVTISQIGNTLSSPGMAALNRPVIDQTGLTGTFDMSIQWVPERMAAPNADSQDSETTFLEALNDQLGLKLESITAPIQTLIIDHVEPPSPN
jgi:uncharacterized protein (TIGR03435 family)